MRVRRYLLTCLALLAFAVVWNGFVHLVVLRASRTAVQQLLRPDLAEKAWLSLLGTAVMIGIFVWGQARCARTGSMREAVAYGLAFAVLVGVLVDLNQYALYPLPAWVAASWFAAALVEFSVYALLARALLPLGSRA